MSDDLEDLLRDARVPEPSEDLWRRLPASVVLRAFSADPVADPVYSQSRVRGVRPAWLRMGATLAATAAGLVLGFFLWHRSTADPYRQLASGKEWREVTAQYGARVRAIVRDAGGLHVVLSEQPDVPAAAPIWIELQSGGERHAAVTVSGQEIEVGGRKIQVLTDAAGRLILVGPDFFWSQEAKSGAAERVQVRSGALPSAF